MRNTKIWAAGLILLASNMSLATDLEPRTNLFVIGCFTPEFQDIFDGDLDGYLLINDFDGPDGAYLPRNYDPEIPNQNCDLPLRRSKRNGPFDVIVGTFFEVQLEIDNTSTTGGGPLDAPNTMAIIDVPEGLVPYATSRACTVTETQVICNLGMVRRNTVSGVAIRFFAAKTGSFLLESHTSSDIFDPNPNNNRSSATIEVVPPETELYFPWISKNAQFSSTVIINNFGNSDALVWLSAVRSEGEPQARPWVIPARGFLKRETQDILPDMGNGTGYSIRLLSQSPHIRGRWVSNNLAAASGSSPSQGVAIKIEKEAPTKTGREGSRVMYGYLPISSTSFSAPVLVNTGSTATDVTLDFYDEAGNLLLSDDQTVRNLAPSKPFAAVANQLLGQNQGDVYLMATSETEKITGVSFVFNSNLEPSIGNVTSLDNFPGQTDGTNLVLPWISNNEQFESIVVVNNFSDAPAEVTLTGRRQVGDPETVSRTIPAHGFLNELASNLFPTLGHGAGYTVEVTSPSGSLTGYWVSNNLTTESGRSPSQGVGIRLDDKASPRYGSDILFGFLPTENDFISAPVIVNVGSANTDVTLHFFNEAGEEIAMDDTSLTNLEPMRPFATVANNLIPANGGDVYMIARSSQEPISGVSFVFNSGREPAIGNVSRIDFEP